MKKLLLTIALLFPMVAQSYMLLPIISIMDGDTIRTDMSSRLPWPLGKVSIRILKIDTPEIPAKSYYETGKLGRASCVKEAELALEAKRFVEMIASGHKKMKVENFKWDKFGGRILADVKIGGMDIGNALIDEGLAVPYFGGTKTKDWCE